MNASLPELNVQVNCADVEAVSVRIGLADSDSMPSRPAGWPAKGPVPLAATSTTEVVMLSVRSSSVTVSVSKIVSPAFVSASNADAPSPVSSEMTGASFVPVMVTTTSWSAFAVPSVARTL